MNELYHYEVLGMKWGRRKAINKANKEAYKQYSQFKKDYYNGRVKKAKGNYESDLDRFNATLRKNTNIDLNKVNKYQVDRGKKAVTATIATFGAVTVAMIAHDKYKK